MNWTCVLLQNSFEASGGENGRGVGDRYFMTPIESERASRSKEEKHLLTGHLVGDYGRSRNLNQKSCRFQGQPWLREGAVLRGHLDPRS